MSQSLRAASTFHNGNLKQTVIPNSWDMIPPGMENGVCKSMFARMWLQCVCREPYLQNRIVLLPESMGYWMKNLSASMGYHSVSCQGSKPQRLPKQHKPIPLLLVAYHNKMERVYCWRHHSCWEQVIQKSTPTSQDTLSLVAIFYSAGRCYEGHREREEANGLIQH